MTPTPTPAPVDGDALVAVEGAVALFVFAVLGFVLVWVMLRISDREPRVLVTILVGLLTFTALIGFTVTEAETLGTLAATGLGALAGAVSSLFDRPDRDGEHRQ